MFDLLVVHKVQEICRLGGGGGEKSAHFSEIMTTFADKRTLCCGDDVGAGAVVRNFEVRRGVTVVGFGLGGSKQPYIPKMYFFCNFWDKRCRMRSLWAGAVAP